MGKENINTSKKLWSEKRVNLTLVDHLRPINWVERHPKLGRVFPNSKRELTIRRIKRELDKSSTDIHPTQIDAGNEPKEAFKLNGISYFDTLPVQTEPPPRQTLLPMSLIKDWVKDYIAANPNEKRGINWKTNKWGIRNPNFGSVDHYATVEYDKEGNLTKYLFDGILQEDGILDTLTNIATPGSVVAPIEEVNGHIYVHCLWQWRPAAWYRKIKIPDHLTKTEEIEAFKASKRGMWMLTVPGGFADAVGEKPENVAKREAIEEGGFEIGNPILEEQSFNRASVASLINIGYASIFRKVDKEETTKCKEIFSPKKMAVRIDKFKTKDAISAAAVNVAREKLGLISSSTKTNMEATRESKIFPDKNPQTDQSELFDQYLMTLSSS